MGHIENNLSFLAVQLLEQLGNILGDNLEEIVGELAAVDEPDQAALEPAIDVIQNQLGIPPADWKFLGGLK